MRYFSYRNKMRLRSLLVGLLIALVILIAVGIGVIVYLQRYIVYTPEGARLDFSTRPGADTSSEVPSNPNFVVETPDPLPESGLVVDKPVQEQTESGLSTLSGFYVTVEMLQDPDAVLQAIGDIELPIAVLVDVKSIFGNYYYTSSIAGAESSTLVETARVDALFQNLAGREGLHLIAKFPAFRDSAYALGNQDCGLPLSSGALWMDEESCYWLDPASTKVLSHLESIILELQSLGFDEVVLDDFTFPDSANIIYDGDRSSVILEAAKRLSANLAEEEICLSLCCTDPTLAPYAERFYILDCDGSEVQGIAEALETVYNPLSPHLVFCTDSRDTRFSKYGLLRPAIAPAAAS